METVEDKMIRWYGKGQCLGVLIQPEAQAHRSQEKQEIQRENQDNRLRVGQRIQGFRGTEFFQESVGHVKKLAGLGCRAPKAIAGLHQTPSSIL